MATKAAATKTKATAEVKVKPQPELIKINFNAVDESGIPIYTYASLITELKELIPTILPLHRRIEVAMKLDKVPTMENNKKVEKYNNAYLRNELRDVCEENWVRSWSEQYVERRIIQGRGAERPTNIYIISFWSDAKLSTPVEEELTTEA
jgi:hypothetical protein